MDQWEVEGQKRTKLRVRAKRVDFLQGPTANKESSVQKPAKSIAIPAHPFDDDEMYPFG